MFIKKYVLTFALILFSLTFVCAEVQTLGIFKSNECINLKQLCSNCTYSNITSVTLPQDAGNALTNVEMTKDGNEYEYSFCNTSRIGQYIVNGVSDVDGIDTAWAYDFYITTTGYQATTPQSIITFFGIFLLTIISIVFLIMAWVLKTPSVKIFFLSMALLTLAFTVGYNLKIMKDTTGEFLSFSTLFSSFYTLITILLAGASVFLIVFLIVGAFKYFYNLKNGYNEGDYDTYNI